MKHVAPATVRRCVRVENVRTGTRRSIVLSQEPDQLGIVGYSRDSGYSSVVFSAQDWRAVEFGR